MELNYQIESAFLVISLLFVLTLAPAKATVRFIGADYGSIMRCALAVFIATITTLYALSTLNSPLSLSLSFVWLVFLFNRILGLSKSWSSIFTIWLVLIQLAVLHTLSRYGINWQ
ncbi:MULTISPECIES: hypothetical protein [Pseudoalteromonas]|uniref:hypothetical protein n=1 Tax=Pseudoalteromonas TaxID=53246 RepID=UPI000405CD6C|nr:MULTISPECIES: hypothetical protein [Pseudoalteromonas]KZN31405.1 hypothetical protein N483_06210 [Pseudoalteromonas luteoviolacea NCIMB 1944]MCG7548654.1 hypothetical protein [Pseudoalteromonas sp. Of7M-16]